jgi:dGTPase
VNWEKLLTRQRLGKSKLEPEEIIRTPFQRDYDRLIFSSAFRRLKDKTQVFPLPTNDYIRTRLIHSLEVSSVGRSLGRIIGKTVIERHKLVGKIEAADIGDIVSAACLAHDIGNPPFGHAGEDAIQAAFQAWYDRHKDFDEKQQNDLDLFEGNAQGFRILTRLEMQPRRGGLQLTFPTLAAFTKYPRESTIDPKILNGYTGRSSKKHGFFQAEVELFTEVAETVGLIRRSDSAAWWCRHPLAFLVEAADDICYSIVDLEDGYLMGYIPFATARELLDPIAGSQDDKLADIALESERIKYLRGAAINNLIVEAYEIFLDNESSILSGTFDRDLLSLSDKYKLPLQTIASETRSRIFDHPDVVNIQIAGYEVLDKLFTSFADAILSDTKKAALICKMLPPEYRSIVGESNYTNILKITDYISGMSDFYATKLFQQFSGISL